MLVEEAALAHLECYILVEGRGMQVDTLLGLYQFADHLRRGNHPRQPDAWSQDLGECTQVDDVPGVACPVGGVDTVIYDHNRRQMFTLIAELAIGVILNNRDPIAVRQFNQSLAALHGHGGAGGILKVG
jgi:hypothetical protein